jgi:hypothetical protein
VVYARGRELDALFYILGIGGGMFRFGATVPGIARFNVSGALGSLSLHYRQSIWAEGSWYAVAPWSVGIASMRKGLLMV